MSDEIPASVDMAALTGDGTHALGASSAHPLVVSWTGLVKMCETHIPAAPGTNYHAAYAGGSGAIDDSTGPWTMPYPRRTIQVALTAGGTPDTLIVDGTDITGAVIQATKLTVAGSTVQVDLYAFETITRVRHADPGSSKSVTLSTGNGFALCSPFESSPAPVLSVNGVVESPSSSNAATGTIIPTTAPDASKKFCVRYVQRVSP